MLSVLIPTLNDEAVLGRALAPLVAAAVSGLVREVIIADGGSSDASLEIADDAGCRILAGQPPLEPRLRAAAETAKAEWLMILEPCVQVLPGWEPMVRQHLDARPGEDACLSVIDPARAGVTAWMGSLFGKGGRRDVMIVRRDAFIRGGRRGSLKRLPGCALLIRESR